ncbi:hypothetical protein Ancab_019363 [Ancistrocladus abbreviatus]
MRPTAEMKMHSLVLAGENNLSRSLVTTSFHYGSCQNYISCLITSSQSRNTAARKPKDDEDDLWRPLAAPAPTTTSKPLNLGTSSRGNDDDDLWGSIAAPSPMTKARPLATGRGRGAKASASKLGAQRVNRTSSGM